MDCFAILNIEPTTDLKEIKRAYTKLLKVYSPEVDQEGFQKLRAAYEEAVARIEQNVQIGERETSSVDEFMSSFEAQYLDYRKRMDVNSWSALIDQEICHHLDSSNEISNRILVYMQNHYYIPHEVWSILNSHFNWSMNVSQLYEVFDQSYIDFVIRQVTKPSYFRHEWLLKCEDGRQEEFMAMYNQGHQALNEYNYFIVKQSIEAASTICPDHPDLLILVARFQITNGQIEAGEQILNQLIDQDINDVFAYYYRGNLLFRKGLYVQAYVDFERVIVQIPDFSDVLFSLGKCGVSLGKYKEAVHYLKKIRDIMPYDQEVAQLLNAAQQFHLAEMKVQAQHDPDNIELKLMLAEAYRELMNADECYAIVCDVAEKGMLDVKGYEHMISALTMQGNKELSLIKLNEGLMHHPLNYELLMLKASVLDDLDQLEQSLEVFELAEQVNAEDSTLYNNRAHVLNRLERHNEALEQAEYAIRLDPNVANAYKHKADALLALGLYGACYEACEKALQLYPQYLNAFVTQMKLFMALKRYDDVLVVFNRATELGYKDIRLFYEKAYALYFLDKNEEAVEFFNHAIELNDRDASNYLGKGLCYYYMGDYDAAIENFDFTIQYDPRSIAGFHKVRALKQLTRLEDALRESEQAIARDAENQAGLHFFRGEIYYDQSKSYDAIHEYEKAIALNPQYDLAYYSLGCAYMQLKQYAEARTYFDQAIELDPSETAYHRELSTTYMRLKEYNNCLEQANMVLEMDSKQIVGFENKGWALYQMDLNDESEQVVRTGLQLQSDNLSLLYLKLVLFKDRGDFQDALIVSDRILEVYPDDDDTIEQRKQLLEQLKPKKKLLGLF
ncbi:MAG: tetratricopeptide repeat protein [Candidatus Cohnella colombiensis]|uniref:Tetratricopeptide repeat protein n=1 Tax=Candidatus Cohnella colombiensis TaxID=3121368 RepID=A0AA95EXI6_9BACL|nr:MAG: tetratricopeptide repeat protein [Cohnella sp.]